MNSMEFNKIAGATIGAVLVFLLLNFFSGMIYGTRDVIDQPVTSEELGPVLAYAVPIEASATAAEPEEPQIDLHAIFAAADPAAGEKDFRACGACHAVEAGVNKIGPSLYDVVGAEVAHVADFNYSDAMAGHDGEWTPEHLFDFLGDPKGVVPGTKMSYAGMSRPQQRADVIAYLNQASDAPVDLTEGLEPLADEAEAADEAADETDVANAGGEVEAATEETPTTEEEDSKAAEEPEAQTDTDAAEAPAEEEAPADATPGSDEEAATETEEPEASDSAAADEGTEVAAASESRFLQGDAKEGEKVFRRCRACHKVEEGANGVGPSLYNIVGHEVASVEGYNFSPAMKAHGGILTPEFLSEFLEDPRGTVPGNKMGFAGLKDEQDRINVITYLNETTE